MKVEIWSDVVCPFCYIGKRNFEAALAQFPTRDTVEITWRSYELNPDAQPQSGETSHAALARHKGIAEAEARRMGQHVTEIARAAGLAFDFDKAVPANTFLAHQLIHLAIAPAQQDALKERLLAAYFTEGRNLNDPETLVQLGQAAGLDPNDVRTALAAGTAAAAVRHDEHQAQQLGIRGVPFFVFDGKYAVSGAQPPALFTEVLEKLWAETPAPPVAAEGPACRPDGEC